LQVAALPSDPIGDGAHLSRHRQQTAIAVTQRVVCRRFQHLPPKLLEPLALEDHLQIFNGEDSQVTRRSARTTVATNSMEFT